MCLNLSVQNPLLHWKCQSDNMLHCNLVTRMTKTNFIQTIHIRYLDIMFWAKPFHFLKKFFPIIVSHFLKQFCFSRNKSHCNQYALRFPLKGWQRTSITLMILFINVSWTQNKNLSYVCKCQELHPIIFHLDNGY